MTKWLKNHIQFLERQMTALRKRWNVLCTRFVGLEWKEMCRFSLHPALAEIGSAVLTKETCEAEPNPNEWTRVILAITFFGCNASLLDTPRAIRYILTMIDLFTKFGVDGPMPEQSGQTVADPVIRDGSCCLEPASLSPGSRSELRITHSAKPVHSLPHRSRTHLALPPCRQWRMRRPERNNQAWVSENAEWGKVGGMWCRSAWTYIRVKYERS